MTIEQTIKKSLKQVDFKRCRSGNGSGSGNRSSARSDMTCHKCGKKFHIQKDCRSKGDGSIGKPPKKSTNELPECVTKKPVVSDTKDLTTSTTTCNNKKYKWCTSCNNCQSSLGFHWKYGHEEWKNNQCKKTYVRFSNPVTNAVTYFSYLMTTS